VFDLDRLPATRGGGSISSLPPFPESLMRHVIVSFGPDAEFEYKIPAAEVAGQPADAARQWFDREFIALECDVPSPIGKVLIVDRVLSVAKYAGAQRFRTQPDWATAFARNTAIMLGRDLVRVDVPNYTVGY
jgi:hypothetical protein